MSKLDKKTYKHQYYLKNKEHILFYQREYNLKYRGKCRKYYRKYKTHSEMPVDLFMMRNKQKFNEGLNLESE